ncbi:tyrosine-type recombinase/integrase [Leptothoe sp. ISB3NOV94-8A]
MAAKVSLNACNGRLRLVFREPGTGERRFKYLDLDDTALNRTIAERTRSTVEGDIITGNYDPTWNKYKQPEQQTENLPIANLFNQYRNYKADRNLPNSAEKYDYTLKNIQKFFGKRSLSSLTGRDASRFAKYLLDTLAPITAKQRLSLIKGCWEWAIEKQMIQGPNPWKEAHGDVKVPPKQRTQAYPIDTVHQIIAAFKTSHYYSYYADLVRFLFGCGPRFGEAVALRWEHLSKDCRHVWIGESYSRGYLGATKTNEQREFDLPVTLQSMLQQRCPVDAKGTDLIFPAPKGGFICDRSFRNRAWKKTIEAAGVDYKKPRITRSTFISHCSAHGWNPADIAAVTGHDPEILIRHYLGGIQGNKTVPDLFSMDNVTAQRVTERDFKQSGEPLDWLNV